MTWVMMSKTLLKVIAITFSFFLLCACNKTNIENSGTTNDENTLKEDIYFIRYRSNHVIGFVSFSTPDGDTSLTTSGMSNFERTIGPVQKGFKAYCHSDSGAGGKSYLVLECKKNDQPFVVVDEGIDRLEYTVE